MQAFEVRFYKDLCDDLGRQHRVLQRVVRVEADGAAAALAAAKTAFCACERIGDWTLRADGFDLRPAGEGAQPSTSTVLTFVNARTP
ncbi:MAG TPA: hypothetical protein VIL72_07005 [Beijerinckiaceae bacterium]|jgi:uncharacterized heparinase superfamily protein